MYEQTKLPIGLMRIIWAAIILGELAFAVVTMVIPWGNPSLFSNPAEGRLMTEIAVAMMIVVLPAAFLARRVIRGPGNAADMTVGRYLAGNIVFLVLCGGVAIFGIVAILIKGSVGEQVLVPALAVALQIVNYPTG
jgi:hypothetical protein